MTTSIPFIRAKLHQKGPKHCLNCVGYSVSKHNQSAIGRLEHFQTATNLPIFKNSGLIENLSGFDLTNWVN